MALAFASSEPHGNNTIYTSFLLAFVVSIQCNMKGQLLWLFFLRTVTTSDVVK